MAERRYTDVELERALAAARALDARATEADRARLDELRHAHEAFLREVDVAHEIAGIRQRLPPRSSRAWWQLLVPAGVLAAAAAVLVLFIVRRDPREPDLQAKGDAISLVVHAATETGSRRLATGDLVTPGTRLRFEVTVGRRGYLAVFGIDGTGATELYFPVHGTSPGAFEPGGGPLPGAIELDATPGDERFHAVYSEQAFSLEAVAAALSRGTALPAGVHDATVVLHKR